MANSTVAKQCGVGLVFLMILMHWECSKTAHCDVNECKSLFSTIFKDFFRQGTQRLCRSSDDIIKCIDKCLRIFFPDFDFINPNTSIAGEVCSYDFQYDLNEHWNCIGGHFHRLLTCMSKFGSMTPTDTTSESLKMLSCKKFVQALDCPYEILQNCDGKALETVSNLFSKVFSASMNLACDALSVIDVHDLPVMYNLNNSYLSTAACLDKLPDIAGNCFSQYLKDFDGNELYHCRNTCENLGEPCLPSSLMNDFYFAVLTYGKHSCKKDITIEDKLQMQEPSRDLSISTSDMTSEVLFQDSTENPTDENDNVRSDEAKRSDLPSLDNYFVETSTLKYKLSTEEKELDGVQSTIHVSRSFPLHTSIASTEVNPEINSSSSDIAADVSDHNRAYRLEYYLHCLFVNLICVFFFL